MKKGFSTVAIVLTLAVVAVLGFVGWMVWDSYSFNTVKIKTYDDDFAKLQYPSTWTVKRDDNASLPGTKQLVVTGPIDNMPIADNVRTFQLKPSLSIFGPVEASTCAKKTCPIYNVVELNNTNFSKGQLVFTELLGKSNPKTDGHYNAFAVFEGADSKGTSRVKSTVNIGQKEYMLTVNFKDQLDSVNILALGDIDKMKATQSFKDLIEILSSLQVK